ncbi:hypothetical protein ACWIYZ_07375 [Ursidibacter arcticus]
MSLHIVKDKDSQCEFGYKKIENYQIFVSESIFIKMLKAECKKPYNWLIMAYQIIRMAMSLLGQAMLNSAVLTFILSLFIWGSEKPIDVAFTSTMFFDNYQMLLSIFKSIFILYVMAVLVIKGVNQIKLYPSYSRSAPNNIFTQCIFHKLQLQAIEIEEEKKNEMA